MVILLSEEEEINRLIDEAADEYVLFDEILRQNDLTFEEALSAAVGEKERFFDTLKKYGIFSHDISSICFYVTELLKKEQNDDILFLYIALLSEHMLLFDDITDNEQKITLWLDHHKHFEYIKERILKKHKNMTEHKNYSPNISSVFKRWDYSISHDNRKNFNKYMAYIKLYCHMKETFVNESDIALSDYCFANLSNLSEWFYKNYEPSDDIPVTFRYVIRSYADYLNFWHMELNENNSESVTGILTSVSDLIV